MFTIQKNAAKASNTGKLLSSLPKIIKGTSPNQKTPVFFTVSPAPFFEKKLLHEEIRKTKKKNMTLGSMGVMQKSSILFLKKVDGQGTIVG